MNSTKKRAILLCLTISCSSAQAMDEQPCFAEELTQQKVQIIKENLYYARENLCKVAMEGSKDYLKHILFTFEFDFISLCTAYIVTMEKATKLTPSKKLHAYCTQQEAVKKMHIQRKNALSRFSEETRNQIDETLIDRGKLYFEHAQIIYPYLEPYILENNNATLISFNLILTKNFTVWENFISGYASIIDLDFQDCETGKTMLHLATKQNSLDIVTYLIKRNVDCNSQTYYRKHKKKRKSPHKTALHYAVKARNILATELLLSGNCNPNIVDHHGNPPLHYVGPGIRGNMEIFEMLIKAKAKIDARNGDGQTLLYKAVKANDHHGVNYLLQYAADVTVVCFKDESDEIIESTSEWNELHQQICLGEIVDYSPYSFHNCFESPLDLANRKPMCDDDDERCEESRMEIIRLLNKNLLGHLYFVDEQESISEEQS